jgi:hypothetical protein
MFIILTDSANESASSHYLCTDNKRNIFFKNVWKNDDTTFIIFCERKFILLVQTTFLYFSFFEINDDHKKKRIHLTIQLFARMNIANCFNAALKRMRAFIFKMRKKVEEEERERGESRRPRSSSQQASASGAATFGSGFGNSPISPLIPSSLVASSKQRHSDSA